ncbi:uncharacterized protein LOC110981612 isoform X2 [Acanthaster planci]|uniref:Flap endonuclease GEN homolog 1 n=1 Tax=Acanthaster planci TaxID=133434 RepID=A0A8B7YP12_ACAPL|nr:uncharacterized protein LOC110981612 isoform X2 [Acanthaster planci]
MGVNQLWGILAPVKTHKPLKSLKGQTIVVDLSVWICESSYAMQGLPVKKPHLRNLFFRITNLTQIGVNLIFVVDGEPPELKWDEMERRTQARFEGKGRGTCRWGRSRCKRNKTAGRAATVASMDVTEGKKKERKRFKFVVKECQEMLENLGVPCVQAVGEAEALCALINVQGLADACVTEDGDVFLYGARTVYKNFTLNTKDPHIECYSMDEIEAQLGLDQSKLIALGLLLGCDYTPGVVGIGPKQALGLMKQLGPGVDVLDRFRDWANGRIPRDCLQEAPKKLPHCSKCTHIGSLREHKVYGCAFCKSDVACQPKSVDTPVCSCPKHVSAKSKGKSSLEPDVMKKACAVPDFPNEQVIDEFLVVKDKCSETDFARRRPQLIAAQKFISSKLEWPKDYTVEKVFPLVTLWDLQALSSGQPFDPKFHLTPTAVIKKRVRQGVPCVEVQWQTGIPHSELEFPTTIEKEEVFSKAFPELMTTFEETKAFKTKQKREKKTSKSTKDSSKDTCDSPDHCYPSSSEGNLEHLASAVADLSLKSDQHIEPSNDHSCLLTETTSHFGNYQDHLALPDVVSSCWIEKPPLTNSNHPKSVSCCNTCGKHDIFQRMDWTFNKSTTSSEDMFPTSLTNGPFIGNISGIPMNRKPSQSRTHYISSLGNTSCSATDDDIEAELLPLSERLRLKEVLETISLNDSYSSSSSETPNLVSASPKAGKKVLTDDFRAESFHNQLLLSVEESNSPSSSPTDISPPLSVIAEDANFTLGFELTKMLLCDGTVPQDNQLFGFAKPANCDPSRAKHSSSVVGAGSPLAKKQSSVSLSLQKNLFIKNANSDSVCHFEYLRPIEHEEDKAPEHTQAQKASASRELADNQRSQKQTSLECPSPGYTQYPNFSLKFELTNILTEDESLLQRNETFGMKDERPEQLLGNPMSVEKSELLDPYKGVSSSSANRECEVMLLPCQGQKRDVKNEASQDSNSSLQRSGEMPNRETTSKNQSENAKVNYNTFKKHLKCFPQEKFEDVDSDMHRQKNGRLERNQIVIKNIPPQDVGMNFTVEKELCGIFTVNQGDLESESPCLSASDMGQIPTETTTDENLDRAFAPLPIDVDTPSVANESFGRITNQSELKRAGDHCHPIVITPVSHLPRHSRDLNISRAHLGTALGALHHSLSTHSDSQSWTNSDQTQTTFNHSSVYLLNSPIEVTSHEENSPVSLLDRLRKKHGNQNGVVSAALGMKNGGTFGRKQKRDRKVLTEIFSDDNEDNKLVLKY